MYSLDGVFAKSSCLVPSLQRHLIPSNILLNVPFTYPVEVWSSFFFQLDNRVRLYIYITGKASRNLERTGKRPRKGGITRSCLIWVRQSDPEWFLPIKGESCDHAWFGWGKVILSDSYQKRGSHAIMPDLGEAKWSWVTPTKKGYTR